MIDGVIAPFDHTFPVAAEEVSVTVFPEQIVVGPLAVIVGVEGTGFTVTFVEAETPEAHPNEITSTE